MMCVLAAALMAKKPVWLGKLERDCKAPAGLLARLADKIR